MLGEVRKGRARLFASRGRRGKGGGERVRRGEQRGRGGGDEAGGSSSVEGGKFWWCTGMSGGSLRA